MQFTFVMYIVIFRRSGKFERRYQYVSYAYVLHYFVEIVRMFIHKSQKILTIGCGAFAVLKVSFSAVYIEGRDDLRMFSYKLISSKSLLSIQGVKCLDVVYNINIVNLRLGVKHFYGSERFIGRGERNLCINFGSIELEVWWNILPIFQSEFP